MLPISRLRSVYWIFPLLLLLLAGLQYRLWLGDGSMAEIAELERQIEAQKVENHRLLERNHALEQEIQGLKKGFEPIEERARFDLGMIKDGETLYQLSTE